MMELFTFEDLARVNIALKRKSESKFYFELAERMKFSRHPDYAKNWDNIKAANWIVEHHRKIDSVVLDAGGTPASALLPTLHKFGYRNLLALDFKNPSETRNGIIYRRGDITRSFFHDNHFDAVACLSVIEHGVPIRDFFAEMGRIIKTRGSLIISADYWDEKIENLERKKAYKAMINIFSQNEIKSMIKVAETFGFFLTSPIDYGCEEKVVSWKGFEFTFIILAFVKK